MYCSEGCSVEYGDFLFLEAGLTNTAFLYEYNKFCLTQEPCKLDAFAKIFACDVALRI